MLKTNVKIDFYPSLFEAKKEFFYAEVEEVSFKRGYKRLYATGTYYYKQAGEIVLLKGFEINLSQNEYRAYFTKYSTTKIEFDDKINEMLDLLVKEKMINDPFFAGKITALNIDIV